MVLIGQGIGYSASPAMQRAAFAAAGLEGWTYELRDVAAGALGEAVAELRDPACAGANVTVPHKLAVMPLLDAVDEVARAAGAVNTVVHEGRGGWLIGTNTDVLGLRAAAAEVGYQGGDVLVLGGGGAARAVAPALPGARVAYVVREPARAQGLGEVLPWDGEAWRERARAAALLVNATPLGRGGELPVAAGDLPAAGAVLDAVYVAGGTPLVRLARERGLPAAGGYTMLLEQGAEAFERWTGRPAPRAAMRAALPG